MTWEQYLINIGRGFDEHSYELPEVMQSIDFFRLAYKNNVDPKMALEYLYYYLLGETVFE